MLDYLKHKKVGKWTVQHFRVSREEARFENLRSMMSFSARPIMAGEYTRLVHAGRGVIMSDTPAELSDLWNFKRQLRVADKNKPIHINGLGLGICTKMALDAGFRVEVVEIDFDVIELVGFQINDPNLTIVQADAMEWMPEKGIRYSIVWHDIWDAICADNIPQMKTLHRRYGRKCDWQDSWGYDILKSDRRKYGSY